MSAVVENPKAAVKEMDALSSVTPRTGSRTPRTGTSTPRSVRSATPTHTNTTTDDEESVDKSDLPSYMRQTAASMTKRTRSRLEREGSWSRTHEKQASPEVLESGVIPKGPDSGKVTPSGKPDSGRNTPSGKSDSGRVTPSGKSDSGRVTPSGKPDSVRITPSGKLSPKKKTLPRARTTAVRTPPPAEKAVEKPTATLSEKSSLSTSKRPTPSPKRAISMPAAHAPLNPGERKAVSPGALKKSGASKATTATSGKKSPPSKTPSPKKVEAVSAAGRNLTLTEKDNPSPAPVVIVDAAVDLDRKSAGLTPEEPVESTGAFATVAKKKSKLSGHSSVAKSMKKKLFACIAPSRKSVNYD